MSKHLAPDDYGDFTADDGDERAPWWRNFRKWFPYAFLAAMVIFASVCGSIAYRMVKTRNYNLGSTAPRARLQLYG